MKAVLVATAFLTRVPIPVTATGSAVGDAARWFPLVGGALGAAGALVAWVLTDLIGSRSALTATLVVGLGAWVTGAIHLDGLADTADGFGGGRSREEVLRIMRDPTIGSYGATALLIVIGVKVTALATLLDRGAALPILVAAPAISRWTISALAAWLPYARADGGLGQAVTHGRGPRGLLTPTVITALIAIPALGMEVLPMWLVAALTAAWIAHTTRRQIGGVTGDVFGATVELTEASMLLCAALLRGQV